MAKITPATTNKIDLGPEVLAEHLRLHKARRRRYLERMDACVKAGETLSTTHQEK